MTPTGAARSYPDEFVQALDGVDHALLDRIHQRHGIRLTFRGNELHVAGGDRRKASEIVDQLLNAWQSTGTIDPSLIEHGQIDAPAIIGNIRPKTAGQLELVEAMQDATITFAVGPAGTGKTFLAIAHAASSLEQGLVDRIVLTRPVIETGEKLGFLPGSLEDKIDPYMRPLFDALRICLPKEPLDRLSAEAAHPQKAGQQPVGQQAPSRIEIAPLAYMRGRTLRNSVIVLDEAQNTTVEQLKMLLTRLGEGSQIIVTGDADQSDLGPRNGLADFLERYDRRPEIASLSVVRLGSQDIVRHWMVGEILKLYES
jgi:phosphate starvation-inducible PhoH-like protein